MYKRQVTPGETVEPTCGADGKHVYVAKVTFEGTEYTGTKDEAIPATGDHQYGEDGFCTVCNTEQRLATPVLDVYKRQLHSGAVSLVKEYNRVSAVRDTSNPFPGQSFSVVPEGSADIAHTVFNPPLACLLYTSSCV